MPLIRYTYGPDVRHFGDKPIMVEEMEARVLVDSLRRAVRVSEAELEELKKADLQEIAEQVGADVRPRDPKGHFVKKISEADAQ